MRSAKNLLTNMSAGSLEIVSVGRDGRIERKVGRAGAKLMLVLKTSRVWSVYKERFQGCRIGVERRNSLGK
jgi:hypothetical protein